MYLLNGLKFNVHAQHTLISEQHPNGAQYPRGWFLDADNRAAAGVVEVPDPVYPDPELFTTTENPDGSLTATPRTAEDIAQRQANTLAQIQAEIIEQTQARLDTFARSRGYDSIHTAAAYGLSKKVKFQREGQTAVDAMSDTWDKLYAVMAEVQAGTRPVPTGYADVEPLLPLLAWPA